MKLFFDDALIASKELRDYINREKTADWKSGRLCAAFLTISEMGI